MAWWNTTNSEDGKVVQLATRAFRKTGIYSFDSSKVDYLRTLSGKQEQAKSSYFAMMVKQNEKQQDAAVVPTTSSVQGTPTAPQQDVAVVPTTSSVQGTPTAPQQDAVVPTTSTAPQQDAAVVLTTSTAPQQDAAVVPLGTPQYTTPSSMRPRDEKYVTPHMVKLHVQEQRSRRKSAFVRQILPKGYLVMKQSVSVENAWPRRRD